MIRNAALVSVLLGTFLLTSCDDEDVIVDRFPLSSAIVYGQISNSTGGPAADLFVAADGWRLGCPGEGGEGPIWESSGDVETNSAGNYRMVIEARGVAPEEVCLVVRADSTADSLDAVADTGATVRTREEPPLDSVRVDLTFPPPD